MPNDLLYSMGVSPRSQLLVAAVSVAVAVVLGVGLLLGGTPPSTTVGAGDPTLVRHRTIDLDLLKGNTISDTTAPGQVPSATASSSD